MSSYPTVEEIHETYQEVYDFLDLMHAAIAETKQEEKFFTDRTLLTQDVELDTENIIEVSENHYFVRFLGCLLN